MHEEHIGRLHPLRATVGAEERDVFAKVAVKVLLAGAAVAMGVTAIQNFLK